jgi:hypothetical protein
LLILDISSPPEYSNAVSVVKSFNLNDLRAYGIALSAIPRQGKSANFATSVQLLDERRRIVAAVMARFSSHVGPEEIALRMPTHGNAVQQGRFRPFFPPYRGTQMRRGLVMCHFGSDQVF